MTRAIDDILGPSREPEETPHMDWSVVRKGVSITWLFQAFRMDRNTVKKRLAECPHVSIGQNGEKLYDISDAAARIVKPIFNIEEYMRKMNPSELPPVLRKEFWTAKSMEQKFRLTAGELWRTGDVVDVLGDVFTHMKTSIQLFSEKLERETIFTADQRARLMQMTDALQEELHAKLVEMPKLKRTPSALEADEETVERDDAV